MSLCVCVCVCVCVGAQCAISIHRIAYRVFPCFVSVVIFYNVTAEGQEVWHKGKIDISVFKAFSLSLPPESFDGTREKGTLQETVKQRI